MRKWLSKNKKFVIGAVAGALGGFFYWRLIGCSSGGCAITSDPFNSTLYFALLGTVFAGIFERPKEKET